MSKKVDTIGGILKKDLFSNPREGIRKLARLGLPKATSSKGMISLLKEVDLDSLTCEEVTYLHEVYGVCFDLRDGRLQGVFLEE